MKRIAAIYLLFLTFSFFTACQKDETENRQLFYGYQYAPLKIGQQKVFKIDSVIFNDFSGEKDSIRLYYKTKLVDRYEGANGKSYYRLKVERRFSDTLPWKAIRMDQLYKNREHFEHNTDNIPKLKLVFPVVTDVKWNSNVHNTKAKHDYTYKNVNESFLLENELYDSTITVVQNDEENLIEKHFTVEKYAVNEGLIYRKDIKLRTTFSGDTVNGYICYWQLLK